MDFSSRGIAAILSATAGTNLIRLAERRLRAVRAGRKQRGARGEERPSAPRAREGAGARDIARAERERRVLAVQQVAAQEIAQLRAILRGEFARGHKRV